MKKLNKVNLGLIPANSYIAEAEKRRATYGVTDRYSTGDIVIDAYLGGGYGRRFEDGGAYEIITIFGETGSYKSTLATTLIVNPVIKGENVCYFALEDDQADVVNRFYFMTGIEPPANLMFLPDQRGYSLDQMKEAMLDIFTIADIIVVDPISFIFQNSVLDGREEQFQRQEVFMNNVNDIMKICNKTIILTSHVNKGAGEGMDKILGSSAIQNVSTKVMQIGRDKNEQPFVRLYKNRFARHRTTPLSVKVEHGMIKALNNTPNDLVEMRKRWGDI